MGEIRKAMFAAMFVFAGLGCDAGPGDRGPEDADPASVRAASVFAPGDDAAEVNFEAAREGFPPDRWSSVLVSDPTSLRHTLLVNGEPLLRRIVLTDEPESSGAALIESWTGVQWRTHDDDLQRWSQAQLLIEEALAQVRAESPETLAQMADGAPDDWSVSEDVRERLGPKWVAYGSCIDDALDCEGFTDELLCCFMEADCDLHECVDDCHAYFASYNPMRYSCDVGCGLIAAADDVMCVPGGIM